MRTHARGALRIHLRRLAWCALVCLLAPCASTRAEAQTRWTITITNANAGGVTLCNGSFTVDLSGQTGTVNGVVCSQYTFAVTVTATTFSLQLVTPPNPSLEGCSWRNATGNPVKGGPVTISSDVAGPASLTGAITTSGSFYCNTTLSVGGTFRATRTTLTAAPVITTQPASVLPRAGTTTSFSCAASGNPAPTFKWQKLSIFASSSGFFDLPNDATYSGVTTTTLSVVVPASGTLGPTRLTVASGDQFRCVATNSLGSATSQAADLYIAQAPAINKQPANQSVTAGQTATFTVDASGLPLPTHQWQRLAAGSTTWTPLSNGSGISGADTLSLSVVTTLTMNGDQFRDVVTNDLGSVTSAAALLTVVAAPPPIITTHPASRTVIAPGTATFSAAATGTPTPTYQWQRLAAGSATWTNLTNSVTYSGATTTTLSVAGTTVAMSGDQFRMVATNTGGSTPSDAAVLTVLQSAAPVFTRHPSSASGIEGGSVSFTVSATGLPDPTFKWQRLRAGSTTWTDVADGTAASLAAGAPRDDITFAGATSATLAISGITEVMHNDQFRAIASNSAGSATSNAATLTLSAPPKFTLHPANKYVPQLASVSSVSFVVAATGRPAPEYQWQRRAAGTTAWADLPAGGGYSGVTSTTLTVSPVTEMMSGDMFRAIAKNSVASAQSNTAALTIFALMPVDPLCQRVGTGMGDCPGTYVDRITDRFARVTTDVARLAEATVRRTGIVTDGVTQLLLKVPTDQPVVFALQSNTGALDSGRLTDLNGTTLGFSEPVAPLDTPAGKIAFALYHAPPDYPASVANPHVTFTATAGTNVAQTVVTLRQPPLILVHGVWSGAATWKSGVIVNRAVPGMWNFLRDANYPICDDCLVEYGNLPETGGAASFSDQNPWGAWGRWVNTKNKALAWVRGLGVAAAQIDVVAHSMGGLLTRAHIADSDTYRHRGNYQRGDVHKLITIGTPHLGSPLANFLVANRTCRSRPRVVAEWNEERIGITLAKVETLEEYFHRKPLGAFGDIGAGVYGLQVNSPDIGDLRVTEVPSHVIVGRTYPENGESGVERVLLNPIFPRWGFTGLTVSSLLDVTGNPAGMHDTVVPDKSQRDGVTETSDQVSGFNRVVHASSRLVLDTYEVAHPPIFDEVLRLLRASISSTDFGGLPAAAPVTGENTTYTAPGAGGCTLPASKLAAATPTTTATVTMSPAPGTVVRPGASVPVSFIVANGQPIDRGVIVAGDESFPFFGDGVFLSYNVPSRFAGRIDIVADAVGSGSEDYGAATYVVVVPNAPLQSLTAVPGALSLLGENDAVQLQVTGSYADGSSGDLSAAATGTNYSVPAAGAGVASVTADGLVKAIGTGTTTVTVSNGSVSTTVAVTVDISNHAPVWSAQGAITVNAGTTRTVSLTATDADGDRLTISAATLPAFATLADNGGGIATLRLQPKATDVGTVSLTVTALDTGEPALVTRRTIAVTVTGSVTVSPAALRFAAVKSVGTAALSSVTPAQAVLVDAPTWTVTADQPWVEITGGAGATSGRFTISIANPGDVIGARTSLSATLTVTSSSLPSATATVSVTLSVARPGASAPAFGSFDTPAGDATVLAGSIALTGWTLDDIGVKQVELWRDLQLGETTPPGNTTPGDPRNGKIFIANATFVDNARPDVEGLYPTTPANRRAGWGYLMLTWGLFGQGNGTYTFYAFGVDQEGNTSTIGTKTVVISNNTANKPFGSIDTPAIGGDASGPNFGWGLTPKVSGVATCKIQPSGVQYSIDSGPLQPVVYGDARTDIAGAFTGFSNTAAAGGHAIIDWTTLSNGSHTIGWLITDDCNRADGVGSRFFNVTTGTALTTAPSDGEFRLKADASPDADFRLKAEATQFGSVASAFRRKEIPLLLARGYGELPEIVDPGPDGSRTVEVKQGERIEIRLPRGFDSAHQLGPAGERRALPIGSTWDAGNQTFSWQPAPGFFGPFRLVFSNATEHISVRVVVNP